MFSKRGDQEIQMGFHQGEAHGNIASEGQAFFDMIKWPEQITLVMQHNKINLMSFKMCFSESRKVSFNYILM